MASKEVKKKGKYQYLAGNIALFSVSNFVSKILVFLLVPLYTGVLSTFEYGIADMMQVTLLLLVPALTLNMGEAALRFGIEHADRRGSILRIGLTYVIRADAITVGLCIAVFAVIDPQYRLYVLLFALLFAANSLFEFLILYFQGCEAVPIVVIGSVCSTAVIVISNIVFLLVIRIGLNGYIYSQIIAYALASVVMFFIAKSVGIIRDVNEDEELKSQMLLYGTPLIAYSTGSWINNAADRYLVAYICGVAVNGVYGVAYKIPAILMVFQRIFAQAWQMSATKSYKDEKSAEFFTTMYRTYNSFMVIGCAVLILLVNPIATFMFRKEFYEAWIYVPPLLISVIFGALTGFLGSICLAYKDSRSMGIATSVGAVINVALNLVLIPYFGAMGAAVATAISYAIMCIIAYIFVRRYVYIDNNILVDALAYLILVASSIAMIGRINGRYVICSVLSAVIVLLYHKDLTVIVGKLWQMVKSRFNGKTI
ncbi:MAG: polysaccharide biosynthesis C-terminal domain-containing protein [Lachnospiraceae bacterium]|nr:polysaccharide biosynthesis C-terminal domain-containing protein [Lachnospiraceae bacterium]